MLRRKNVRPILLMGLACLASGCLEGVQLLPGLNSVRLELVNDTGFPVDPDIRYDDDPGFWAGLFPAEELSTGLIEPGETVTFNFDCDALGSVFSDEAEQVIPILGDYGADSTRVLQREDEYDCGDLIRFRFVGYADDFGVIVSVNGRVVD
jgi:hypothetical protein